MGRRAAAPEFANRVKQMRIAQDLAQAQLAERAGLSRQAINSIEGGHYVPNTVVALRLARVLHCQVEDLFSLPTPDAAPDIDMVSTGSDTTDRLAVGHVGNRWVGYPLTGAWDLQPGFQTADVVRPRQPGDRPNQLVTSLDELEHTAILLGCDPSLGILCAQLAHSHRQCPRA